jgi:hypothetical protein
VIEPNPARLAEGWEPRFVIEALRVADFVRLYEALGFEVITEPLRTEGTRDDCADCCIQALLNFRRIYTRARGSTGRGAAPSDDAGAGSG